MEMNLTGPVWIHPVCRKVTSEDKLRQKSEYFVPYEWGFVETGSHDGRHSTEVEGAFYVGSVDQILAVVTPGGAAADPQTTYDDLQRVGYRYDQVLTPEFVGTLEDPTTLANPPIHYKAPTRDF